MRTRLSGYQPQYFPRLHYMARMLNSDVFEISDYVQFVKKHAYVDKDGKSRRGKSFQADTPVKLSGGVHYLTVPVQHGGLQSICETRVVDDKAWASQHLRSLTSGYAKAKNYAELVPQLEQLLFVPYRSLAELNIATILWAVVRLLGLGDIAAGDITIERVNDLLGGRHPFRLRKIVLMSETGVAPPGEQRDATAWIIDMCRALGADEYYFGGSSGQAYMDFERFIDAGVATMQQQWVGQEYVQQFSQLGFVPNLSILDLLFNVDSTDVAGILESHEKAVSV